MHDRIPIPTPGQELTQLDKTLVERLTNRNGSQPLAQRSRETYRDIVRQYNTFLEAHALAVNVSSLKLYFESIAHLAPATQNLRKFALLKVLKEQVGADSLTRRLAVEKLFAEQVKSFKLDKKVRADVCLTESQVIQLIQAARTHKTKLLIRFLFVTGCRVSEVIGIQLKDIDRVNGMCKMRVVGKGGKERFVYAKVALIEAIQSEYAGETWLFESRSGRPLHRVNVSKQIRNAGRKLGWNLSAHRLRHSRATDMLKHKGISLKAVSNHLGHASVSTTAGMYIHDEVDYGELFSKDLI